MSNKSMRYIIEVKTKKGDEGLTAFLQEQKAVNVDVITSYDPKERLHRQVEKVGAALREFKASGIDNEVMYRYLKGCGHSQKMVDSLLGDVKTFFKQVGMLD